ncbi:uncharacterized protein B0I36DRAFT_355259 [Microdochium trichocladiopsis]|uniref:Uncharacterized protein n=1 Tax=Microdochium trichocladiopsis TaxID=1682393 RepID=A0A9P8XTH5_9PEZI|nr:uncharacterized protein B0I36DRAFT_355259 [Microdochium trichocladiopsis]KAH7016472.1 hypothetical protein B0I36DRAFT_355259 [Microdochium trichocladiopsis]
MEAMPSPLRSSTWLANKENQQLYPILRNFHHAMSSIERDKIYALLGLCGPSNTKQLVTDYTIHESEVVRNTTAYICGCDVQCLPLTPSDTIKSFLDNLATLHSRTFSLLLRSTDVRAMQGVMFMLRERHQYFDFTTTMMEDAARNEVHGAAMIQSLLERGPQD